MVLTHHLTLVLILVLLRHFCLYAFAYTGCPWKEGRTLCFIVLDSFDFNFHVGFSLIQSESYASKNGK